VLSLFRVFVIDFSFATRNSTEFAIKEEKLAYSELLFG